MITGISVTGFEEAYPDDFVVVDWTILEVLGGPACVDRVSGAASGLKRSVLERLRVHGQKLVQYLFQKLILVGSCPLSEWPRNHHLSSYHWQNMEQPATGGEPTQTISWIYTIYLLVFPS